jgi:hypothetical protein
VFLKQSTSRSVFPFVSLCLDLTTEETLSRPSTILLGHLRIFRRVEDPAVRSFFITESFPGLLLAIPDFRRAQSFISFKMSKKLIAIINYMSELSVTL